MRGQLTRHAVDPAQAAKQRHHGAAIFGHGQHRRFAVFLAEHGGQAANHDAGGAQHDQRRAGAVERAQVIAEVLIGALNVRHSAAQTVDVGLRIQRLDAPGAGQGGGAEDDDGGSGGHKVFHSGRGRGWRINRAISRRE